MSESTNYAYPKKIAEIPYASFMKIRKWSYNEAMAKVAQNQKDALGSVQNSGLMKQVSDGLSGRALASYANGTNKYAFAKDQDAAIAELRKDSGKWEKHQEAKTNEEGFLGNIDFLEWIPNGTKETEASKNRTDKDILDTVYLGRSVGGERQKTTLKKTLEKKARVKKFREEGYKESHCNLALPNEFQYSYGANWGNTFKLGTMALLADDPTRALTVTAGGAGIGGLLGYGKNFAKDNSNTALGSIMGGAAKGGAAAADLFGVNSSIADPRNIAGLAGMAPNENAIQFFQKMEFRQFELNFEFASRDKHESKMIRDILQWFKIGMHPTSLDPLGSGSGVLLGFPDVFELEPKFVAVSKGDKKHVQSHKMMPKTKLCALSSITVNTSPFGTLTTVHDGSIPLITATLRFNELTALTRADFFEQAEGDSF